MEREEVAPGTAVVREGEPGSLYYLVIEGEAVASLEGRLLRTMGPGEGFGEIALLRDVARTATVVARGALRTATLQRREFLAALSASADSATAADALVRDRMEAGAWSGPAPGAAPPAAPADAQRADHDDAAGPA
jgi:CRP-like cAMP-binding protein